MKEKTALGRKFLDRAKLIIGTAGTVYSILVGAFKIYVEFVYPGAPALSVQLEALCVGVAALTAASMMWVFSFKESRWRSFFGINEDYKVLFVLPVLHAVSKDAFKLVIEERRKILKRKVLPQVSVFSPQNFSLLYRLLGATSELRYTEVEFETDENIMGDGYEPEPSKVEARAVICYGSSSSNNLCEYLLNRHPYRDQDFFYRFKDVYSFDGDSEDTGYVLVPVNPLSSALNGLPKELRDDREFDYGILLRFTAERTTYFLCAGLSEEASDAAVKCLFYNWKKLRAETTNRDFFILFKVAKISGYTERVLTAIRRKQSKIYELIPPVKRNRVMQFIRRLFGSPPEGS